MQTETERRDPPGESVHFEFEVKKDEKREPRAVLRFFRLIFLDALPWPSSLRIKYVRRKP